MATFSVARQFLEDRIESNNMSFCNATNNLIVASASSIGTASLSSIIGGKNNCITSNECSGQSSAILSSCNSVICCGQGVIIGSRCSCICTPSYGSVIIGGENLGLSASENNTVYVQCLKIHTVPNNNGLDRLMVYDESDGYVKYRDLSTIPGGGGGGDAVDLDQIAFGTGTGITSSTFFAINTSNPRLIFGPNNTINSSSNSVIIGGSDNILCQYSHYSTMMGGYKNCIYSASRNSNIIGGSSNQICCSCNSSIIGGSSLSLCEENNIVYVPELKVDNSQQDDTLTKVLVWDDAATKLMKWRDVNTISGGGTTVNIQTILTYTMSSTDANNVIVMDSGSPQTVVIDTDANVSFTIGSKIDIIQIGTGTVSVSAVGGVTLNSKNSWTSLADQYVAATLLNIGTDDWILIGNLTT